MNLKPASVSDCDDEVAPQPVVAREMIEVLGVERVADRGGGLERRGCAHGQEVVDLADRVVVAGGAIA